MLSFLLLPSFLLNVVLAQTAGSIVEVGDTQVSAMMVRFPLESAGLEDADGLVNGRCSLGMRRRFIYWIKSKAMRPRLMVIQRGLPFGEWSSSILVNGTAGLQPLECFIVLCHLLLHFFLVFLPEKTHETNSGSCRDIASSTSTLMDMTTNTFCASGMHLPNGSFATFGGNQDIGPGGIASNQDGFLPTYDDQDGGTAIRILNPSDGATQWFDNANLLAMQQRRWYAGTEALADGSVVLIGGFVNGGYVNRNFPNTDPTYEGGGAEPTYEFFPARDGGAQLMQFMTTTSGLNSYAHAYLMPSGQMFVQANLSTSTCRPSPVLLHS